MRQSRKEFTATGASSFVIPAGVKRIRVELIGAGGGGAGCRNGFTTTSNQAAGGGGGGAGKIVYRDLAVTPGDTYTVNIPVGGTHGTGSTTPTAGSDGGAATLVDPGANVVAAAQGGMGGRSNSVANSVANGGTQNPNNDPLLSLQCQIPGAGGPSNISTDSSGRGAIGFTGTTTTGGANGTTATLDKGGAGGGAGCPGPRQDGGGVVGTGGAGGNGATSGAAGNGTAGTTATMIGSGGGGGGGGGSSPGTPGTGANGGDGGKGYGSIMWES